jgi:hypothetical protein
MIRLVCCLIAFTFARSALANTADEAEAHRVALDLAGAFSNDGFKIRDGVFTGTIHQKETPLVQVNLYAGNQYWFIVGATDKARRLAVTVFDETGLPLKSEPYAEGSRAAAGFSPTSSGPYFIRVEELEGGSATFCLIYSYK